MSYELKSPCSEHEWEQYHQIRKINIFDPLGMDYDPNHECMKGANQFHYVLLYQADVIGTIQLETLSKSECAIRTITIADAHKNKGHGSEMIKLAEMEMVKLGCSIVYTHANPNAISFYERNGYVPMEFPGDVSMNPETVDMGKSL